MSDAPDRETPPTATPPVPAARWPIALLLVGAAVLIVLPTLRFPTRWADPYDWRYFEAMEEVYRLTVALYHQVPLWNPYICGGEVALANPQSTIAAPTFLLSLIFGTPLGLKLSLLVYFFCALHGAYWLARELGVSVRGALVCGFAFGTCGWFALHLSSGHINFAGAALHPYMLVCYRRALLAVSLSEALAWAIPGGASVAWMAGLGGTYTAPMGAVLLVTVATTDAVQRRSLRPIFVGGAIAVCALLLGAARFLPTIEFAIAHPRHVPENDANDLFDLARALLAYRQTLAPVSRGHVYWWHEYCCHLPYFAVLLVVIGLFLVEERRKRAWWMRLLGVALPVALAAWTAARWMLPTRDLWCTRHLLGYLDIYWLLAAVVLWRATARGGYRRLAPLLLLALGIAVGKGWPHGPWWLLRKLPLYHDLRVPSRYLIMAALALSLGAGLGLDALTAWLAARGRAAGRYAVALVALVALDGLAFSAPTFRNVFIVQQDRRLTTPPPFSQQEGDKRWMFSGVLAGQGTMDCDEEAPLQRAEGLDVGTVDQVRLVDPSAGTTRLERWTPNELEVSAELTVATDVLINQNWNEHWRLVSGAGEVRAVAGRLAVRAPVGNHRFVLRYQPRSFLVGELISAASLAGALLFLVARRYARRRRPS